MTVPHRRTRIALRRVGIVAALLVAANVALLGAAKRAPSIALVLIHDVPAFEATRAGFVQHVPNTNVIELHPDLSNARSALETLRNAQPDMVVALGSSATLAVTEYLPRAPLLFGLVLQPGTLGGRGGARHGFTLAVEPSARVEALARVFSPLERIAILCGPGSAAETEKLVAAAEAQGVRADVIRVAQSGEITPALRGLDAAAQVLLLATDPVFLEEDVGRAIVRLAFERRVPVVGFSEKTVKLGGLAALEIDYRAHGAELARAAIATTSGRATNASVRPSSEYRWVVNPQTARSLGITLPPDLLSGGAASNVTLGAAR